MNYKTLYSADIFDDTHIRLLVCRASMVCRVSMDDYAMRFRRIVRDVILQNHAPAHHRLVPQAPCLSKSEAIGYKQQSKRSDSAVGVSKISAFDEFRNSRFIIMSLVLYLKVEYTLTGLDPVIQLSESFFFKRNSREF